MSDLKLVKLMGRSTRKTMRPVMLRVHKAEKEVLKHVLVPKGASDFAESADGEDPAQLGDLSPKGAQEGLAEMEAGDSSYKTGSALGKSAAGEPQTPSASGLKAGDNGEEDAT